MAFSLESPILFSDIMDTHVLVICEGASECNYLVHLQRFLRELPPMAEGGISRVRTFAEDLSAILKQAYPEIFK